MKILVLVVVLLSAIFFVSSCTKDHSTPTQNDPDLGSVVSELNSIAQGFNGSDPSQDSSDLSKICGLGDVSIVGMGEATHGSREFFEMKHRIFKYLAEEKGFRIFGFECELAESLYLDHYICTGEIVTGEADLRTMMKSKVHFWTWRVEEVAVLVEWMRSFNVGRSPDDMVHLYGVDCQSVNDASFFYKRLFSAYKPSLNDEFRYLFAELDKYNYQLLKNLSEATRTKLISDIERLKRRLEEHEGDLIKSGVRNYKLHLKIADVMIQTLNQITGTLGTRDGYMGENAMWMAEINGGGGVALWAHNGHSCIARGTGWSSMGKTIRDAIGNRYQTIAFGFAKGGLRAYNKNGDGQLTGLMVHNIEKDPPENSINRLFYKADLPNLLIKISDTEGKTVLRNWLNQGRHFLSIGSIYGADWWFDHYGPGSFNLVDYCDYFIWFRTVREARGL